MTASWHHVSDEECRTRGEDEYVGGDDHSGRIWWTCELLPGAGAFTSVVGWYIDIALSSPAARALQHAHRATGARAYCCAHALRCARAALPVLCLPHTLRCTYRAAAHYAEGGHHSSGT